MNEPHAVDHAADRERPLAADDRADLAAGDHQRRHHERVGVIAPWIPVTVVPTSFGDGRDRDVHHRAVQRHQELARRQRQEDDLTARRFARHPAQYLALRRGELVDHAREAPSAGRRTRARRCRCRQPRTLPGARAVLRPGRAGRPRGRGLRGELERALAIARVPRLDDGRSRRRDRASGRTPRRPARSRTRRTCASLSQAPRPRRPGSRTNGRRAPCPACRMRRTTCATLLERQEVREHAVPPSRRRAAASARAAPRARSAPVPPAVTRA